jgi:hypothetical protein
MKNLLRAHFLVFMIFGCFSGLKSQDMAADWLKMRAWFSGEFDNFQQAWKEKEDNIADSLRHEHIHSIFLPVDMPELGKNVFFVKQYMDGDTDKIYRMRVYNFFENKAENAIQLDIFTFKDKADETRFKNANRTPDMLKNLKPENFTKTDGCEVFWKFHADKGAFIGYMKDRACNFVSKRSGKRIFITDSLRLTENQIWIGDRATDENGNYVFGNKAGIQHKLVRCRYFKGWAAVKKPDATKDNEYNSAGTFAHVHDQGWRARLKLADGTPTKYTVELSQVIYGKNTDVLKLAVYEEGNTKAIAYTWANPDAKRIGINIREMQIGLTLEE